MIELRGDVNFCSGDQYVGINEVLYEGDNECLLFNWASKTSKKNNTAMATLVNKATRETITKGRSLEGDIASHNLCVISDTRAITQLQQRFDPDRKKNYYAFAIGGEYRDPTDSRGNTKHYDGIKVMGLTKHRYNSDKLWSALQWIRLHSLLKGDHAGAVEGRSKCKRKSDNLGIAEFDGQSALTYFQGQFFVYARANPKESGYRDSKVCMCFVGTCLCMQSKSCILQECFFSSSCFTPIVTGTGPHRCTDVTGTLGSRSAMCTVFFLHANIDWAQSRQV